MKQYVSYVEAVHAYARGLCVWIETDQGLETGFESCWAPTCEAFARDPEARKRAAKVGARSLRLDVLKRRGVFEGENPRYVIGKRNFSE